MAKKTSAKASDGPKAAQPKKAPANRASGGGTKKAAASRQAKAPAGGASPPAVPMIDTGAAAQAAAALIKNRALLGGAAGGTGAAPQAGERESATFRQLKDSLSRPAGPGGILQPQPEQKKGNLGHGPSKQLGRNQTFGADVNRAFVPRRTSG